MIQPEEMLLLDIFCDTDLVLKLRAAQDAEALAYGEYEAALDVLTSVQDADDYDAYLRARDKVATVREVWDKAARVLHNAEQACRS